MPWASSGLALLACTLLQGGSGASLCACCYRGGVGGPGKIISKCSGWSHDTGMIPVLGRSGTGSPGFPLVFPWVCLAPGGAGALEYFILESAQPLGTGKIPVPTRKGLRWEPVPLALPCSRGGRGCWKKNKSKVFTAFRVMEYLFPRSSRPLGTGRIPVSYQERRQVGMGTGMIPV